jgi:anti-sigma B factor antagonist
VVNARGTVKTTDREGVVVDVSVVDHRDDGVAVVALRGQLDIDTAANLRDALRIALDRPVPRIVIDLSELTFCDSIGLSSLALAHNHCVESGGYLRLAAPNPFLRKVLTVVGLAATLPMYETVEGARAADSTQEVAPVSPGPVTF